jgi:acrylyl-CoA reductase (NADPH)
MVSQTDEGFIADTRWLSLHVLQPAEVLIRVAYAAMNYKDALVCTGRGKVAQTYPLVPGVEFAGRVVESLDQRFTPGDEVLAYDFGCTLGISRHGGYSEYARVPGEMLFPLSSDLDCKQALVLSAGTTVAMALRELEKNGLGPQLGPVLVTGATGGVGSLAVSLLSKRGYAVTASTGKAEAHDYLRQLGASEILGREEVSADSSRPLETQRWAGSIDTVGGTTLAYLMRTTKKGGAIAAIGVAGGATFHASVYPLILRGIKVLGIDMPSTPLDVRQGLWEEITRERALLSSINAIVSEANLEDIPRVAGAMLDGRTRGRILIRAKE